MKRQAWIEVLQYIFVIVVLLVNITVILKSQAETRQARQANINRQADMIDHFDCVILLGKKYPKVNFQALSYQDSKQYLVECAKSE